MSLFYTDSICLCYRRLAEAKKFWLEVFDCKPVKVPSDWAEVERAGFERPNGRPILFCNKLKKAHEHLTAKGAAPGPIQDGGGTQFFEVVDPEGTVIEICKEP